MHKTLEARDGKSEGKFESLPCLPVPSHIVGVLERFNPGICPLSSGVSEEWTQATEKAPYISFTGDRYTGEFSSKL